MIGGDFIMSDSDSQANNDSLVDLVEMPTFHDKANDSTVEPLGNKTLMLSNNTRYTTGYVDNVETRWYWDKNKFVEVIATNAGLVAVLIAIFLLGRFLTQRMRKRQQAQVGLWGGRFLGQKCKKLRIWGCRNDAGNRRKMILSIHFTD